MTRADPLAALLRLRRTTLDEMQRKVATAYDAEREAGIMVDAAGRALEQEARAAMSLSAGDETVETYARWLPVGRRAHQRALDAERAASAELDRARAMLVLARAEVRTVELQIEARTRANAARMERRDRDAADEAARTLFTRRTAGRC